MSDLIHACYVCHRITFGGMPTADTDAGLENVSHGVCSECEPAERARIERETDEVCLKLWADKQWNAARATADARNGRELPLFAGKV